MNFFHYLVTKYGSKSEIETVLEAIFKFLKVECNFEWKMVTEILRSKTGDDVTFADQISKKGYSESELKTRIFRYVSQESFKSIRSYQ